MHTNESQTEDAVRAIKLASLRHSRSLEDRIQANFNQFYRFAAIFALSVLAVRLGYQAVTLTSLPHMILLLACLIGIAVIGNIMNKFAAENAAQREFERLNKSYVTYCDLTQEGQQ